MAHRAVVRPPYRVVLRLYAIAASRWAEVEARYYQVDLLDLSVRKFLNLVFAWCVEGRDPEKIEEWLYLLEQPLPGEEKKVSDSDLEADAKSFMDLMGS